jgi:hypothetical protein
MSNLHSRSQPSRPHKSNPLIDHFKQRNQLEKTTVNPTIPAVIQDLLSKPVSYFKDNPSEPDAGKAPLTNVAFILDCSGSMEHGKDATIEGFNTQVSVVREGAKDAGRTTFTDVHFSHDVELRCVAGSIDELQQLDDKTYQPGGNTALLDALGCTIAALLPTPDINSPDTAMLVTLFTDGEENSSRIYDVATVKALVERLEATGRWTFALVGPMQSVTSLGEMLSVKQKNVSGFDSSGVRDKRRAFDAMSTSSAFYLSQRSVGIRQTDDFFGDKDAKK